MAGNRDITSANAVARLSVDEIYPSGIDLLMFGTDQALDMGEVTIAEHRKGVDGRLVFGHVPGDYNVTITLEAASPSYINMATIWQATTLNLKPYTCNLQCTIPSISSVFIWSTGTLISGTPHPSQQKVLAPTTWVFTFEDFITNPI